jgi:hypothetical protein
MFNTAMIGMGRPTYLSSDHHPVFTSHRWKATVHGLGVKEIKTIPYVPVSHPFVERLIGTIRRECLDRTLFWTAGDLERKLVDFQRYYNGHRLSRGKNTAETRANQVRAKLTSIISHGRRIRGHLRRRLPLDH